MDSKRFAMMIVVILVGLLGLFAATQLVNPVYEYQGSLIEPAVPAYDFALLVGSGGTFQLSEQHGKVVLIFFGYANCPDFCPTTLAEFKRVREELGSLAEQVEFVFITIDPERDTPALVEQYVHAFHPDFIGLSGTEAELQPIWDAFYVYRARVDVESAAGYLMEHSTRVVVVDPAGDFRMTFPYGMQPEAMAADITELLNQ